MNILIPMAGAGSRFQKAGYPFPKPLIDINGKPMIQWVLESLHLNGKYIFIVQKKHYEQYDLKSLLNIIAPNCEIILTEGLTEGAACTTLLAEKFINNDDPLLISNADQYIKWNSTDTIMNFMENELSGGLLTFESIHPKHSFAKIEGNNLVTEVAEKKVISNNATVGIYFWKKGSEYIKYANDMIKKNIRTNNEFYICPVYNQAIKDNKKFIISHVDEMWGMGTPEELNNFIANKLNK